MLLRRQETDMRSELWGSFSTLIPFFLQISNLIIIMVPSGQKATHYDLKQCQIPFPLCLQILRSPDGPLHWISFNILVTRLLSFLQNLGLFFFHFAFNFRSQKISKECTYKISSMPSIGHWGFRKFKQHKNNYNSACKMWCFTLKFSSTEKHKYIKRFYVCCKESESNDVELLDWRLRVLKFL